MIGKERVQLKLTDEAELKLKISKTIADKILTNSISILDELVAKTYGIKNHVLLASLIQCQTELFLDNS